MIQTKVILSNEAPSQRNIMWAKPVSGGFTLYIFIAGKWQPFKMVDDKLTATLNDDTVATYDALGAANAAKLEVVGTASDSYDTLSLNGLKKYVDMMVVTNGHPYVEIGGIKWATMNIGATSVTDYGLYFQWGDTQGYTASQVGNGGGRKYFGWTDYKYGNGTSSQDATDMTKYNSTDGKTVLEASDDAVTAAWGGSWRMPTREEYEALGNAVNTAWTSDYQGSGVAGMICTDKTDPSKTLFFPACGFCYKGSFSLVGDMGRYFSSSLESDNRKYVCKWECNSMEINTGAIERAYGLTVRGVLDI